MTARGTRSHTNTASVAAIASTSAELSHCFRVRNRRGVICEGCSEVYTPAPGGSRMRWKSALAVLALVSAGLIANASPLYAQAVQTSTLTGTVKDNSGGVLPGVTVTASSPSQVGGAQTSVTDSQGVYRFPALHPGIYQVDTALSGLNTVRQAGDTLQLGTTPTIDLTLAVTYGSQTE